MVHYRNGSSRDSLKTSKQRVTGLEKSFGKINRARVRILSPFSFRYGISTLPRNARPRDTNGLIAWDHRP